MVMFPCRERKFHRLPAPRFGLRLALGEFAQYILMSQRIAPAQAQERGYAFEFPEVFSALDDLVGSGRR